MDQKGRGVAAPSEGGRSKLLQWRWEPVTRNKEAPSEERKESRHSTEKTPKDGGGRGGEELWRGESEYTPLSAKYRLPQLNSFLLLTWLSVVQKRPTMTKKFSVLCLAVGKF